MNMMPTVNHEAWDEGVHVTRSVTRLLADNKTDGEENPRPESTNVDRAGKKARTGVKNQPKKKSVKRTNRKRGQKKTKPTLATNGTGLEQSRATLRDLAPLVVPERPIGYSTQGISDEKRKKNKENLKNVVTVNAAKDNSFKTRGMRVLESQNGRVAPKLNTPPKKTVEAMKPQKMSDSKLVVASSSKTNPQRGIVPPNSGSVRCKEPCRRPRVKGDAQKIQAELLQRIFTASERADEMAKAKGLGMAVASANDGFVSHSKNSEVFRKIYMFANADFDTDLNEPVTLVFPLDDPALCLLLALLRDDVFNKINFTESEVLIETDLLQFFQFLKETKSAGMVKTGDGKNSDDSDSAGGQMDHQRNAPTDGNEEFNSDSSNETGNSGISEPHDNAEGSSETEKSQTDDNSEQAQECQNDDNKNIGQGDSKISIGKKEKESSDSNSLGARAKKRARSSSIEDKSDDEDDIESIDYGSVLNCLRNHCSDTESCTTTNVRKASQLSTKHTEPACKKAKIAPTDNGFPAQPEGQNYEATAPNIEACNEANGTWSILHEDLMLSDSESESESMDCETESTSDNEETSKSTKNLNTISVCPAINASVQITTSISEKDDFKNSVFQGVDTEQNGGLVETNTGTAKTRIDCPQQQSPHISASHLEHVLKESTSADSKNPTVLCTSTSTSRPIKASSSEIEESENSNSQCVAYRQNGGLVKSNPKTKIQKDRPKQSSSNNSATSTKRHLKVISYNNHQHCKENENSEVMSKISGPSEVPNKKAKLDNEVYDKDVTRSVQNNSPKDLPIQMVHTGDSKLEQEHKHDENNKLDILDMEINQLENPITSVDEMWKQGEKLGKIILDYVNSKCYIDDGVDPVKIFYERVNEVLLKHLDTLKYFKKQIQSTNVQTMVDHIKNHKVIFYQKFGTYLTAVDPVIHGNNFYSAVCQNIAKNKKIIGKIGSTSRTYNSCSLGNIIRVLVAYDMVYCGHNYKDLFAKHNSNIREALLFVLSEKHKVNGLVKDCVAQLLNRPIVIFRRNGKPKFDIGKVHTKQTSEVEPILLAKKKHKYFGVLRNEIETPFLCFQRIKNRIDLHVKSP